jgi:hypothetical protein
MQEMPTGFQMGPKLKRMAPTWKSAVASFFALATALIFQHPGAHQQANEFFDIEDYNSHSPERSPKPDHKKFSCQRWRRFGIRKLILPTQMAARMDTTDGTKPWRSKTMHER